MKVAAHFTDSEIKYGEILENRNAGYAITLRETTESSEADVPVVLNCTSILAVARRFKWPEVAMLEKK